ncbi:hypothetical protein [Oceanobacter mangrovi]|uniref:hypothetical protein n=1 Tax=Oceanobacter mangrovi TaxID=2862510 RepID=UPI001C8DE153|nr:hypothetical protein [Oceanobacter mangrovi]
MSAEMMPLFWRIAGHEHNGQEAVSLLMPANAGESPAEFPTEVCFQSNRHQKQPVDLRWSDEDSDLFMSLLDRVVDVEKDEDITLDINDGVVQGIVQLVALARFKKPMRLDQYLDPELNVYREEMDVGDLISVRTSGSFVLAILVSMDSVEATCVLLEPVEDLQGEVMVAENTLFSVDRLSVLPAVFADSDDGQHEVLH